MLTGITLYSLNLREGPGLDRRVIVVLTQGMQLSIVRDLGEWLEVRAPDGTIGFVASRFVERKASAALAEVAVTLSSRKVSPTGVFINIRSTPIIAPDNVIGQADGGTLLTPLEDDHSVALKIGSIAAQNLWMRVRTPSGLEGYVAAWLLKLVEETDTREAKRESSGGTISVSETRVPVEDLRALYEYIDTIPDDDYPLPQSYHDFWAHREKLGLPDPFDVSPTKPSTYDHRMLPVNGFGPNTFAFLNWMSYYRNVCGMHNGLDHIVPAGTPLLAVADGIIAATQTNWPFMTSKFEKALILWPYLPEHVRDSNGRRMLSNVLVAYAHMSDNTSFVGRLREVKAGQVIGLSGHPINQNTDGSPAPETDNPHLHLEVHLLTGDNNLPRRVDRRLLSLYKRPQPFDNSAPFNPMLFFSPRMVKYHLHQGKKLGFGNRPTYPSAADLAAAGRNGWPALDFFSIGCFQYQKRDHVIWTMMPPWGSGIYDMPTLLQRIQNYTPFEPYPADFLS